jgi:hypothetical protein
LIPHPEAADNTLKLAAPNGIRDRI